MNRAHLLTFILLLCLSACQAQDGSKDRLLTVKVTDDFAIDTSLGRSKIPNEIGCVFYDSEPIPTYRQEPEYPPEALSEKKKGKVWVKASVDSTGRVVYASVLKSDDIVFNRAALKATMNFKFKPAIFNKRPVASWVSMPFRFSIPRND